MNKIKVFLSSSMTGELDIERSVIRSLFKENEGLKSFCELYAIEEHGSPRPIDIAYKDEVSTSDVVILLLDKELRQPVVEEYFTAKEKQVDIFCYIKYSENKPQEMKEFIFSNAYTCHCNNYYEASDITGKIKDDILNDIIRVYTSDIRNKFKKEQEYAIYTTSKPKSEYRLFSTKEIIDASRKEHLSKMDEDQLISLSVMLSSENYDYKLAILLLEITLMKNPKNWMAHNDRGIMLQEIGLTNAAMFSYKKSIKYNPQNDSAYYNIGNIYYELGNYNDAIYYYNKALEYKNNKESAINKIMACYIAISDYDSAVFTGKDIVKNTNNEFILSNYILSLIMKGDFEAFHKHINRIGNRELYLNLLYRYYFEKADYLKAYDTLNLIEKEGYDDYIIEMKKFECLIQLDRKKNVLTWFQHMEENYPISADDYNNIGYTLMDKYDMHEMARDLYKKAIELNQYNMVYWNNLQASYGQTEQYEEGLKACEDALKINPIDSKSIKNKTQFLYLIGDIKKATEFTIRKSLEIFGDESQINNMVSMIMKSPHMDQLDKYGELYKKLIDLNKKWS